VSWWRRLFNKDQAQATGVKRLSLKEQYQRKVQLYGEMAAASNAALEVMAQLQGRLHDEAYFSPAYVKLNCALVLDHTRRVMEALKDFTGEENPIIAGAFARIAAEITNGLVQGIEHEAAGPALPFEGQTLAGLELLASGVAYRAKEAGAADALGIKAVWGWWPAIQDGTVRGRRYRVAQGRVTEQTSPETGPQEQRLAYHPGQGFVMEALPQSLREQPCLEVLEATKIADYYRLLSNRYPQLQEVEWVLGPSREVIFLRSLPHAGPSFQAASGPGPEAGPLFSQGLTIYPGLASGPAFRVDADQLPDNLEMPAGAVLFATKPALDLAPLLDKIAALVVETGEPQSHLAFLVRERRLPAIFDLGADTSRLPQGQVVSVDAGRLEVTAGLPAPGARPEAAPPMPQPLAAALLKGLSPWLFPLHTGLPGKPATPGACQSIHDLLVYAATARRQEMFCYSLRGEVAKKDAVSLVTGRLVPILVIDAGGGLARPGASATFEEVSSLPFRAFLGGMMSIPWPKARPLDVKGFISVIGVTSTTPQAEDQLRRLSFALLSREYMNFSLCLGYHASTIEAYLGSSQDSSYIRFHYEGGAASIDRRLRRLQLIGEILVHLGFQVNVTGDLLDGLVTGEPEARALKKLEILGRLEVYTKQMDMVMADDAAVASYVAGFLGEHCEAHQAPP
jgi:pyruvate, water dikinase